MPLLPTTSPSGTKTEDIVAHMRVDGSEAVEGTGGLGVAAVEFGVLIPGPVAIHVGPTPPFDTSLLWVDTS
jgi:hypothetical protein